MSGAQGVQRRMELRRQQKAALEKQISDARVENNQTMLNLVQGFYGLTKDVMAIKETLAKQTAALTGLVAMAQAATWRSMALQKVISTLGIPEEKVIEKANELLVADFEAASDSADVQLGLVKVDSEEAKSGYTAVASLKTFLKGEEAVAFRSIRNRFEIGGTDTFPEISEAVIGMKVGDTKRFALVIQDKVDECELTLLGLRAPVAKEEHNETQNAEENQSTGE